MVRTQKNSIEHTLTYQQSKMRGTIDFIGLLDGFDLAAPQGFEPR
jgi:hypothetical protein